MSTTYATTAQRDIEAALRVATIIGTFKQIIAALVVGFGSLAIVGVGAVGVLRDDPSMLVMAGLIAIIGGLLLATYWAMFGWFEHVLRLLARIAGNGGL